VIVALLLAGQVVLLALGLWRELDDGREGVRIERLETGVPHGTSLSIETAIDAATRRAQGWAENAFLFAAAVQVDWPKEPGEAADSGLPESGWVLLTFGTESGGEGSKGEGASLSLLVDRVSGAILDEREMAWGRAPTRRLDITTYPISSTISLFAADLSIGNKYRAACPQFRHLSRASFAAEPDGNGAYWLVTYEDSRSAGRPELRIEIDAMSGEVTRDDSSATEWAC
jgi:hypothetical protein